ncbi:hypothetical protein GCM10022198_06240 [Klugiella xanthotipulae]
MRGDNLVTEPDAREEGRYLCAAGGEALGPSIQLNAAEGVPRDDAAEGWSGLQEEHGVARSGAVESGREAAEAAANNDGGELMSAGHG